MNGSTDNQGWSPNPGTDASRKSWDVDQDRAAQVWDEATGRFDEECAFDNNWMQARRKAIAFIAAYGQEQFRAGVEKTINAVSEAAKRWAKEKHITTDQLEVFDFVDLLYAFQHERNQLLAEQEKKELPKFKDIIGLFVDKPEQEKK